MHQGHLAAIVYGALALAGLFLLAVLQHDGVAAIVALLATAGAYVAQTLMNGDIVADSGDPEPVQSIGAYTWALVVVAWICGAVLVGMGV